MTPPLPTMYRDLASWWPLLSAPEDYAEEAAFYLETLVSAVDGPVSSLLELGSGGGNNALHMKSAFEHVTLVDLSEGMLRVSRDLNPECEHVEGDMRSVRLDRTFDCVFIHDAICYMTSEDDLRRAVETAFVHCRVGGAVLLAPDHTRESFQSSTEHGGHDGTDRALRYIEWTWDPDPDDSTYVADYAFLLRDADGTVDVIHDRHVEGLFSRETWMTVLRETGFEPRMIPFTHTDLPRPSEVFAGTLRSLG